MKEFLIENMFVVMASLAALGVWFNLILLIRDDRLELAEKKRKKKKKR